MKRFNQWQLLLALFAAIFCAPLTVSLARWTVGSTAIAVELKELSHESAEAGESVEAPGDVTAERVPIPGTGLSLIPPSGFTLATQYSGFENLSDASSIVLFELPAAAAVDLSNLFTATPAELTEAFASRGLILEVESLSTILRGDVEVPFAVAVQTVGGLQVKKYFALIEEGNTQLLMFNIMPGSPLTEADVVATIRSAGVLLPPSVEDATANLPFIFEVTSPFQYADSFLGSSVLLMLRGEVGEGGEGDAAANGNVNASGETPMIIIASSLNPTALGVTETDELADFSERLLRDTADFSDVIINRRASIEFAGGQGYLIKATSLLVPNSSTSQYVRVLPDGHYIRMVVLASPADLNDLMPAIQSIQRSVSLR